MLCPFCSKKIKDFSDPCPYCGRMPKLGKNASFFEHAQKNTLTFADIFSDVFKKHSHGDLIGSLLRQASRGTNMLANWYKPWLFFRLFVFLFLISLALSTQIQQPYAYHMYIIFGSMVIPLTLMVFIWELDIHANISIFDMFLLMFFGGILSLTFAGNLNRDLPASYYAAFTEEPTKLAVCLLFISISKRKYYALDGLAIGAAIGAGFAFMESIQYVYQNLNISLVIGRGIRAIASHILYTAPVVGIMTYVMHGRPFSIQFLKNKMFLGVFGCAILSHAIHNADFYLMILIDCDWLYLSLKDIINTIFIWFVFLYVVRLGVRQALMAQSSGADFIFPKNKSKENKNNNHFVPNPMERYMIYCTGGEFAHRNFYLMNGQTLTLGRDPARCQIHFKSTMISGVHCQLRFTANGIELCDLDSKNGTCVNGKRLAANHSVVLHRGDNFSLYKEQFVVR